MEYRFVAWAPGYDLGAFDCGTGAYNRWLAESAGSAVSAGTAQVYLLLGESPGQAARVLGYFAICPTAVVPEQVPSSLSRATRQAIPGYLVAKLALDASLRGQRSEIWSTQLVVEALRRIGAAADIGGGRVIVVDADNAGLVKWYQDHSFRPTGADPLRLYMKVATARRLIDQYDGR